MMRYFFLFFLIISLFILTACIIPIQPPASALPAPASPTIAPLPDTFDGLVESIAGYRLPAPAPTKEAEPSVVIATSGARANVRSGPGLNFPIIAKANPGEAYKVVGKSEDNAWWQICCVSGANSGDNKTTTKAWLASSVVRLAGAAEAVNVTERLFEQGLQTQWSVDWECASERCEIKRCSATVEAKANRAPQQQLLAVEHTVTWDKECFARDSWVFDINQYSGKERTGEFADNFLYGYWLGSNPGQANGVYSLGADKTVGVWCSGPHTVEVEEGSGWTTVYEGNTCHDVRTGMLVLLSYNKRWLFTGEFNNQKYERAFFGDSETLKQRLVSTNVQLLFVEK